jgi:hypothetical protein
MHLDLCLVISGFALTSESASREHCAVGCIPLSGVVGLVQFGCVVGKERQIFRRVGSEGGKAESPEFLLGVFLLLLEV